MTIDPITISENIHAIKALEIMESNRKKAISVLPIINKNNEILGLLRLHDLVKLGIS